MSGRFGCAIAAVATALATTNCTSLVGDGDYYIVEGGADGHADASVGDRGTNDTIADDSSGTDTSAILVDESDEVAHVSDDAAEGSDDVGETSDDVGEGAGGGDAGGAASCIGLAATCGASGNTSCCSSSTVPGGTFNRSNDATYPATVSNFVLDTYEITVGRFRKFVAAYSQSVVAAGAGKNLNNASDPGWSTAWNASLPTDATT
jgi:sulfatase modifying factor 1